MDNKNSLPYLQGGPPGALGIYIAVEAVVGVILCCISVIGSVLLLFHGQWISLISVPLTIYSTSLTWKAYSGVKKLRRDEADGASMIASACGSRRNLIWIGYAFGIVASLISAISSRSLGLSLLSVVLVAGLLLLVVFPLINYYKDVEQILEYYAQPEMISGCPVKLTGRIGHLSALCVTFAVLMLAASIAADFVPDSYLTQSGLLLYLVAARYLLVNICYHGFLRSHRCASNDENPAFAPSGYSASSAFCVLGSIFFGGQVFSYLETIVWYIRNGYAPLATLLAVILDCVIYALFALALARRSGGTVLIVVGASAMLLTAAISMFSRTGAIPFLDILPGMLFFAAVLAAAVIRLRGKAVPNAFRIVMIVLAVLYVAASNVLYISNIVTYGFRYVNLAMFLSRILNNGIYLTALLALIHALAKPAVSGSGDAEQAAVADS